MAASVRLQAYSFLDGNSDEAPRGKDLINMNEENLSQIQLTSELVRRAQEGDEAAFARLVEQYTPLIDSVCDQYSADAPSEQELLSEAFSAFWGAVRSFDDSQSSVTFGLYAKICLNRRIADCLRKQKRIKPILSLDSDLIAEPEADEDSNPAHYVMERENYLELMQKMELLLSQKERQIWLLFVEGNTASEIANQLDIEKKDAENAIFRARKKLRQHIPPRS